MKGGSSASFEWRSEDCLEAHVVHIKGEIDLATAALFEEALNHAIQGGQPVVLCFNQLTYLDCSALHCLERAHARVSPSGQQIVLAELPPVTQRVIEILGFQQLFPVFTSVQSALQFLDHSTNLEADTTRAEGRPGHAASAGLG
jgi:anti-anti-sigma factor